jgi:extradiol dioxygenase family protein
MNHSKWIHTPIHIVDKGTEMERQKMYLNCPSGYLIEIKGYKN